MMTKKKMFGFLAVCFVTAAGCAAGLCVEQNRYRQAEEKNQEIRQALAGETADENAEESAADRRRRFERIREKWPDTVAWIGNDDASWGYAVMQGEDNEYYMNHLPDGTKNACGSVFLDRENRADFTSLVSVVYGHHVKKERMFGYLDRYREQEYYDSHPSLYLYTPDKDYRIDLAAGYLLDGATGSYPVEFTDEKQMEIYLEIVKGASFFDGHFETEPGDRLVILSTCAYDFDNARLALVGLLRER